MSFFQMAEFKVGILVLTVAGLIAYMSMQVSDDPSYLGRSKKAWFLLPNASGIIKNSNVRSAGIPIGVVKDVRLQDGQARVDISVTSETPLTTSAAVEVKAVGILGDKHVEVYPGSPTDPPLPDGGQILNVKDSGSLDNVVGQVSDLAGSLKVSAEALRESITQDGTNKHVLGRIIHNLEKLSGDIAEVTGKNKGKINDIIDDVKSVSSNLNDITGKIQRGEGTIGKLVNDESTIEEINTAVHGVNNLIGTADRMQTSFDFHGEYMSSSSIQATKSYIGIKIQPGLDRYYYVALIDDPTGVVERTSTVTTPGGTVEESKTYFSKTKLTLLYAKNFFDFTIRGGLIENTGGVGFDYSFYKKKLVLSLDAFNFQKVNFRPMIKYNLFHGLYLVGGVNDLLDRQDQRSGYLGAGLFLTNDDLKLLLARSPF